MQTRKRKLYEKLDLSDKAESKREQDYDKVIKEYEKLKEEFNLRTMEFKEYKKKYYELLDKMKTMQKQIAKRVREI